MRIEKRIVKWKNHSRAFIIGGYSDNATSYQTLINEGKKDFPSLKEEEICISKIQNSRYMKGFICISFGLDGLGVVFSVKPIDKISGWTANYHVANTDVCISHPEYNVWNGFDFDY